MGATARTTVRLLFALCAAALVAADGPPPAAPPAGLLTLLSSAFSFTAGDLEKLQRGEIVKRTLDTRDPREVAVAGAVHVRTRQQVFLDRFRDIARFKRGAAVLQINRFSNPPVLGDVAALTMDEDDINDLRQCRVGDCDVQLSAAAIEQFQAVNWAAPDAAARATSLAHELVLDYARRYVSGAAGRREYNGNAQPMSIPDEFAGLLAASPYIGTLVPGMPAHLLDYPAAPLAGAEDFLYWSKEKFGLRPVISVTHVTIAPSGPGTHVITSKDIYSSHYFDASLGLTIASDDASGQGFYLVYVNRSRADALKGGFSGLKRSVVQRRAKGGLEDNLRMTKLRLERNLP